MTFEEWLEKYTKDRNEDLEGEDLRFAIDVWGAGFVAGQEYEQEARRQRGKEILDKAHKRFMGKSIIQKGKKGQ